MNLAPRLTIKQILFPVLLINHFPASGFAGKGGDVVGVDSELVVPAVVVEFSVDTSSSMLVACDVLVPFVVWAKAAKQNKAFKIRIQQRNKFIEIKIRCYNRYTCMNKLVMHSKL